MENYNVRCGISEQIKNLILWVTGKPKLLELSQAVEWCPGRHQLQMLSALQLLISKQNIGLKKGLKSGFNSGLNHNLQLLSDLVMVKAISNVISSVFQLQTGMEMNHSIETNLEHWLY